jgi:hypothetical protein
MSCLVPFEALHGGDGVWQRRELANERLLLRGGGGVLEPEQQHLPHGARHCDDVDDVACSRDSAASSVACVDRIVVLCT